MSELNGSDRAPTRMGNVGAMVRVMRSLDAAPINGDAKVDAAKAKRKLVADLCKLLGEQMGGKPVSRAVEPLPVAIDSATVSNGMDARLPPRMQQTLQRLLAGDAEKEIARRLGVSKHTVHVYVKALYRKFEVNSRGELLARFVNATYRGDSPV
ncbi:MAG: Transcriptional regulator, LuxR family [Phycisphaerales bacterium]|nr:Transcriptional regulator, LuxR family [Phycisphaerales bacterium]